MHIELAIHSTRVTSRPERAVILVDVNDAQIMAVSKTARACLHLSKHLLTLGEPFQPHTLHTNVSMWPFKYCIKTISHMRHVQMPFQLILLSKARQMEYAFQHFVAGIGLLCIPLLIGG